MGKQRVSFLIVFGDFIVTIFSIIMIVPIIMIVAHPRAHMLCANVIPSAAALALGMCRALVTHGWLEMSGYVDSSLEGAQAMCKASKV